MNTEILLPHNPNIFVGTTKVWLNSVDAWIQISLYVWISEPK